MGATCSMCWPSTRGRRTCAPGWSSSIRRFPTALDNEPSGFALLGLPVFWVAFALAARGFFNPLWNVNVPTVRQTLVPLELQGRVSAVLRMVGFGAAPLGALAGGAVGQLLANRYGDANGYALTLAGASVVAAASGFALSSRSVRRFRLGDAD
jgi:hypothetical protein